MSETAKAGDVPTVAAGRWESRWTTRLALPALAAACLVPVFMPAFRDFVFNWTHFPEYGYGPLVPLVGLVMILRDARLRPARMEPSWAGPLLVGFGSLLALLAHFSPFVYPADLGLLVVVLGLLAGTFGWTWARAVWPGIVYLLFALPLPGLLFAQISTGLQLFSSEIGVAIIHAFGISAFRDGNVIDLGRLELQVAEACSGLRYLFPLASFAFLAAYLFKSPPWQRAALFLSALPITIAMNSVRIALTGLLADAFGSGAAQGFIHAFEGWLVFCACIGVLFLEMQVFCRLDPARGPLSRRLDLTWPAAVPGAPDASDARFSMARGPRLGLLAVAVLALLASQVARERDAVVPDRQSFAAFPYALGSFQGEPLDVEPDAISALGLTDYLSMRFATAPVAGADLPPMQLWIAYYDSQHAGDATHSPRFCIPGSGWSIDRLERAAIAVPDGRGGTRRIPVNRVLISKGAVRQLVYYWFQERGRSEADEYRVKLDILLDGFRTRRTDGALVRLVTPIGDGFAAEGAADDRLKAFAGQLYPQLPRFIPE